MDGFMTKRRKKQNMNKTDKEPEEKEPTKSRFRAIQFISHRNAMRQIIPNSRACVYQ